MKRMRKIVIAAIVILSAGVMILNACSQREAIALPVDIANRVIDEIDLPMGVMVNDENIAETGQLASALMGDEFNPALFDGFAFYPSVFSSNASEFGILKVKNEPDVEKVKEIINSRMEDIKNSFADDVRSDQYKIAKNGEIRADGKYIYYSVTEDNGRILNIIDEMLKDK